ncbi:MAG: FecCD family ABC transporter permease [Acidimicrobiia bacterium]
MLTTERPRPTVGARPVTVAAARGVRGSTRVRVLGLVAAVVGLVAVALASVAVGAKSIPVGDVFDALVAFDGSTDHVVVRTLRVPRTLLGIGVAVALGLAGAVMQGVTRNPLADPGILGVNAGASLAVIAAIQVFGVTSLNGYVWFAFLGAAVASVAVYGLGALGRDGATPIKLALAGAAIAAFAASVTTAILIVDVATLEQYRFWVVGSIAGRDGGIVAQVMPFLVAGTVLAVGSARALNTLSLGDDVARSLGLRVGVARGTAAVTVVLLCGGATAAAGPITFVGLTVPHIARAIAGPDYRWVLPYSAVLAPILLLGADVIGRIVVRPGELQAGIVTAVVGAPFFIALVRRRRLAQL